jgi:hypothetical protein
MGDEGNDVTWSTPVTWDFGADEVSTLVLQPRKTTAAAR